MQPCACQNMGKAGPCKCYVTSLLAFSCAVCRRKSERSDKRRKEESSTAAEAGDAPASSNAQVNGSQLVAPEAAGVPLGMSTAAAPAAPAVAAATNGAGSQAPGLAAAVYSWAPLPKVDIAAAAAAAAALGAAAAVAEPATSPGVAADAAAAAAGIAADAAAEQGVASGGGARRRRWEDTTAAPAPAVLPPTIDFNSIRVPVQPPGATLAQIMAAAADSAAVKVGASVPSAILPLAVLGSGPETMPGSEDLMDLPPELRALREREREKKEQLRRKQEEARRKQAAEAAAGSVTVDELFEADLAALRAGQAAAASAADRAAGKRSAEESGVEGGSAEDGNGAASQGTEGKAGAAGAASALGSGGAEAGPGSGSGQGDAGRKGGFMLLRKSSLATVQQKRQAKFLPPPPAVEQPVGESCLGCWASNRIGVRPCFPPIPGVASCAALWLMPCCFAAAVCCLLQCKQLPR